MNQSRAVVAELFADPTCPWCFVGWRALNVAQDLRPEIEIQVAWRPFLLRPDAPPEGQDRAEVYAALAARDPDRWQATRAALTQAAAAVGAEMKEGGPSRLPHVIDAHRLIHWASGQDKGPQAIEAVFSAYWTEGKDIGDREVLLDIAAGLGLDRPIVGELLDGEADRDLILAQHAQAQGWGVGGVPLVTFDRKSAVAGAESPEVYAQAIDKAMTA